MICHLHSFDHQKRFLIKIFNKGKYRVVLNPPDRTKCLINYNEMAEFSKSILIDSLSHNASQVKCEIKFGTELKTESPNYLVFFAGKILNI